MTTHCDKDLNKYAGFLWQVQQNIKDCISLAAPHQSTGVCKELEATPIMYHRILSHSSFTSVSQS